MTEQQMKKILDSHLDAHLEKVEHKMISVKKTFIKETIEEVFSLNGIDPRDFLKNQKNFHHLNMLTKTAESVSLRIKSKLVDILVAALVSGLILSFYSSMPK